jgi:hypothetical protein
MYDSIPNLQNTTAIKIGKHEELLKMAETNNNKYREIQRKLHNVRKPDNYIFAYI